MEKQSGKELSNYDDFYIASREETVAQIGTAETVLEAMKEYLKDRIEL